MSTAASSLIDEQLFPQLAALMRTQYERTPAHRAFLESRFSRASAEDFATLEELASQIRQIAGPRLGEICDGYDFICKIVREEEIFFRRHGRYRLTTFEEANRLVYGNTEYMGRYMDGLLLTQIYWSNHTACYQFYRNVFLRQAPAGYDYLEIGPGHGLLLYQALKDERSGSVKGWDVSKASIGQTWDALTIMGMSGKKPELVLQDLYAVPDDSAKFDCLTFSEVRASRRSEGGPGQVAIAAQAGRSAVRKCPDQQPRAGSSLSVALAGGRRRRGPRGWLRD